MTGLTEKKYINNNMDNNITKKRIKLTNVQRRSAILERLVDKVPDVEEEMNVRNPQTKKYIKEKVNRKELAETVKDLYNERKITQSDKISRLIQDLIRIKTKTPIRQIQKVIDKANTARFKLKVLFFQDAKKMENETDEQYKERTKKYKMYKGYRQSDAMYVEVIANELRLKKLEAAKLIEDWEHKIDPRTGAITETNDKYHLFDEFIKILKTNEDCRRYLENQSSLPDALLLINFVPVDKKKKVMEFRLLDEKNTKSMTCKSMNSIYISTELDMTFDNFKEALDNKNYIENECWINTIMDYYGNTILSPDKALRYRFTRENLLDILKVNEETVKQGLSVNDVLPFFEKFRLPLKVFNELGQLIFKYEPENPHKQEKRCYVLIKGYHIYTMNQNLEKLRLKDVEDANLEIPQPSPNFLY